MKKAQYIFFLAAITAFVGCNKVELDPDSPSSSPTPVLTAHVTVNGDTNLIEVGEHAILSTYHNTTGVSPYLGASYTDVSGNDLLSFDFGFLTTFDQSSFLQGVEFGSLECDYVLDNLSIRVFFIKANIFVVQCS